jgi:hypothetical protein
VLNFDYKGWGDSDGAKTRLAGPTTLAINDEDDDRGGQGCSSGSICR